MGFALFAFLVGLRRLGHNFASFGRYLWGVSDHVTAEKDLRANRIQVITTIVQAVGGVAVLIGIYFAWANLKDTQKNQTDTLRVTTEGQITDRFTKAIDQLGATDIQGQPRPELRLGGIYTLERIARESEEDHWPIMEVLTTYVRMQRPFNRLKISN